jgi:hypothetical protein
MTTNPAVIKVHEKAVYGQTLLYVTDKDQAVVVATLTGKKTVGNSDLAALRALGLTIEVTRLPGSN